MKFAKEEGGEGTIAIVTERKHSHAPVKVNDTGPGIDSEILPQLFSKFNSKSYQANGLGLLFIVKIIIEFIVARIGSRIIILILIEKKEIPFTLLCQLSINDLM